MTHDEKVFYNSLVKRLKDAETYMDNDKIATIDKMQHKDELLQIMRDMHTLAKEFKLSSFEMRFGMRVKNKRRKC